MNRSSKINRCAGQVVFKHLIAAGSCAVVDNPNTASVRNEASWFGIQAIQAETQGERTVTARQPTRRTRISEDLLYPRIDDPYIRSVSRDIFGCGQAAGRP